MFPHRTNIELTWLERTGKRYILHQYTSYNFLSNPLLLLRWKKEQMMVKFGASKYTEITEFSFITILRISFRLGEVMYFNKEFLSVAGREMKIVAFES